MFLKICVQLLLLLLLLQVFIFNTTAQELMLGRPNCQTKCGNVTIPFPFGIGKNCYLNPHFEIHCQNNIKPILGNVSLEVLEIQVEKGTIKVKHPVFKNCQKEESLDNATANLAGTPFYFSQEENMFTGLGCDNIVYMRNEEDFILGGCLAICNPDANNSYVDCSGIYCCQTRISSSLQFFNLTVGNFNGSYSNREVIKARERKECSYAFLVEQSWFHGHRDKVSSMKDIPVVLDWRMDESYFRGNSHYNSNAVCKRSTTYRNTVHCRCDPGFTGNPYLDNGCTDIDECKSNKNICRSPMGCVNTAGSYNCSDQKLKVKLIILGILISLVCLFMLFGAWWLYVILKRRKEIKQKEKYFKRNGGLLLRQQLSSSSGDRIDRCKLFNSKELDKATDNFNIDRVLGQGGQGTVYKGMLADGGIIAVKKSKVVDEGKLEEFINEVVILSQINHRNVVKLLGCCLETEVPLLVYEFISSGTLFQYLHGQNEEVLLTWDMRLRIATEIAGSLSYLHSAASLPIYHRDIKSTNILLDDKFRAKVADFGTSKFIAIDQTHVTTKIQGTFGYMDPEFYRSSQYTAKSDVYSFGVVLAELLTGKMPISFTRAEEDRSLVQYFLNFMEENRLYDILDPQVQLGNAEEIMAVATLAKKCLNMKGKKRPNMKEVSMELEGIRASRKESKLVQKYQEVECVESEKIQPWDIISSSSSTFTTVGALRNDQLLMTC